MSGIKHGHQDYARAINDNLSLFREVHGDLATNVGLHLPDAPIGTGGMPHPHARCQDRVEIRHAVPRTGCRIMTQSSAELAGLIGSRICHDLISPIGAIANGLELLDMSGGPTGPEMDLISDSAGNAGARIRFFRIAYGASGEQALGASEIRDILAGLTSGGRIAFDWLPDGAQPRGEVQLAFLAMQCCESAMPKGGRIRVIRETGWSVIGEGEGINAPPALWTALQEGVAPETVAAATVQFALLVALAGAQRRPLSADCRTGSVSVRF